MFCIFMFETFAWTVTLKRKDQFIFKKRGWLITANRAFLHSWLPLCFLNKIFRNTSLLLKTGIHHKPSREEAAFDGHNTLFQSQCPFCSTRSVASLTFEEKHTKTSVNINQKCTAPFLTQLPITGLSRWSCPAKPPICLKCKWEALSLDCRCALSRLSGLEQWGNCLCFFLPPWLRLSFLAHLVTVCAYSPSGPWPWCFLDGF